MTYKVHGDLDFALEAERTDFGPGTVVVDPDKCQGCMLCALICPAGYLEMRGEPKKKKSYVREGQENCMACACCEAICESGAIKVVVSYDFGGQWKQHDRGKLALPRIY